jgi:YVTN family beta-propeller protein
VVANFAVGASPSGGIAVSPDNRMAYVANLANDTGRSGMLPRSSRRFRSGTILREIAVSPLTATRCMSWRTRSGTLCRSSMRGSPTSSVCAIRVGFGPRGIVVSPDGSRIYVTTFGRQVVVIDAARNAVVSTFPVGRNPWGMALHPTGSPLYVVNNDDNNVSVVTLQGSAPTVTIPVAVGPHTVASHARWRSGIHRQSGQRHAFGHRYGNHTAS